MAASIAGPAAPPRPRPPRQHRSWWRGPRHEDAEFVAGAAAADRLRPHGLGHVILFAVALFFVAFLAWARWATLDEVTRGEAKVIPSRQVQVVQNLEGGIIAAILVREGDVVDEGQVLMRIDNVRAASDYREKRSRYLALLAAAARLRAEIDENAAVTIPPEVLAEARDLAENELALFRSRQEKLQSDLDILGRQAEQRQQELTELRSRLGQLERSYKLAAQELDLMQSVGGGQRVVPRGDLLRLERQVNDLQGALEQGKLAVPRAESALREANKRIENAFSTFRTDAQQQLNAAGAEMAGLKEVVTAGEDRVRRTEVRSPVHGTVKTIKINTVGGVTQPGADLVEVVPLEDTLLVEAQVRPADIAFLRPGLPATVKITAYDFSIYGGLKGTVEDISADTITNDRGEAFYRVRVRTDRNYLGSDAKPLRIIPGMTAQVDVLTGRKTVLDYLLKPILKARYNALTER
jgi:adhesin transport system membrane fusion protein